ncbi:hypothetical protein KJ359_007992 [Pestalotiopsis sp. 9143b]|nr:hypothetical protein KJ359_007992 [Pestalotiopsis sp. 9143b]
MAKIFEDIICQRYVRQQSNGRRALEEDRCKAPDVQSELATLQAWSATLEYIPGLLVAVPFGTIADRFGHKLVLVLSSIGVMLHVLAQIIIWFGLFVVATILCMLMPSNTAELKRHSQTEDVLETRESDAEQSRGLSNWAHNIVDKLGAALYWIAYENRPVGYMLLSLLITVMAKYAASLELQYITKRYDLSWESVSISTNFDQHNPD